MKVILCIMFFCISQNVFCQISGKIINHQGEKIPYANVLLLNSADSTLSKGALTDEEGTFKIENLNTGSYFIRIQFIGYKTFNTPVFTVNSTQFQKDFGAIIMNESVEELGEVVIVEEKPFIQQEIDRMVVNVGNSALTKGSSALQVLERTPSIIVNRQSNEISLNGKNGVVIMINEKIVRLPLSEVITMLNGMNADNIEKIELITTPPAKYDVDGVAGMVNIVLKENQELGTNGSVTLSAGNGWGEKGGISLNLNHRFEKVNIYAGFSMNHNRTYYNWDSNSEANVPIFGGLTKTTFSSKTKQNQNYLNSFIGIDFDLNAKTTVGGSVKFSLNDVKDNVTNFGRYDIEPDSIIQIDIRLNGNARWQNLISNAYLEKKFDNKTKLNLDFDYLHYDNRNPYEVKNVFYNENNNPINPSNNFFSNQQKGRSNTSIGVGVISLNYEIPLNNKVTWQTGLKGTYSETENIANLDKNVNVSTFTQTFTSEKIGAVYSSFDMQLNQTWKMMIGTRYEYWLRKTKENENNIDWELGRLFPSVFLLKTLSKNSDIQLSYTKRVSRPTYRDMTSYLTYNDPISVFTGNPLLQPMIAHTLKVGYSFQGYTFSVWASRDENPIFRNQITENREADLIYITPQNLAYQNSLAFQANIPIKISKWWNINAGFTSELRQFKLNHTKSHIEKTYLYLNPYLNQTFRLPKKFTLELSGWLVSSQYNGSSKLEPFGMLNLGLKKEFKNSTLQFSVSDVFQTRITKIRMGELTEEAFSMKNAINSYSETANARVVQLAYSFNFGNKKIKAQKNRNKQSKDEMDRL
jgi:iron complex outermembrane recepter protein